jgi:hypothetical protein
LPAVFARASEAQRWLQDHVSPGLHSERASCEKSRFLCRLLAAHGTVLSRSVTTLCAESANLCTNFDLSLLNSCPKRPKEVWWVQITANDHAALIWSRRLFPAAW